MGIIAKAIQAYKDLYKLKDDTHEKLMEVENSVDALISYVQDQMLINSKFHRELESRVEELSKLSLAYQESNNETIRVVRDVLEQHTEFDNAIESDLGKVLAWNHDTDKKVAALIASHPNQGMYHGVLKT